MHLPFVQFLISLWNYTVKFVMIQTLQSPQYHPFIEGIADQFIWKQKRQAASFEPTPSITW